MLSGTSRCGQEPTAAERTLALGHRLSLRGRGPRLVGLLDIDFCRSPNLLYNAPSIARGGWPMDDLVGKKLEEYQIVSEIGRGGMAIVYKAYQPSLNRHVAIKVLKQVLAGDPQLVQRFVDEARRAANLDHPNVTHIHAIGHQGSCHYIVMQLVEGPSLEQKLFREGALAPRNALAIFRDVGAALDYAHSHREKLVHRDVKPANILLAPGGRAILSDFGIARAGAAAKYTSSGMVLGTATYMSPEQAQGRELDGRSDLYSLSVVLYRMLSGQAPFAAESPTALLYKHVHEAPVSPSQINAQVPHEVSRVVLRGLEKDRTKRFATAGEMAAALEQAITEAEARDKAKKTVPGRRGLLPLPLLAVAAAGIAFAVWRTSGSSVPGRQTASPQVTHLQTGSTSLPTGAPTVEILLPTRTPLGAVGPTSTLVPRGAGATPTLHLVVITPTAVPTGRATAAPGAATGTLATVAYAAPVLLEPADGAGTNDADIVLRWRWDGALKAGECFEVAMWSRGEPEASAGCFTSSSATVRVPGGVGIKQWKVRVARSQGGAMASLSGWSQVRSLDYRGPAISGPPAPPPPPTETKGLPTPMPATAEPTMTAQPFPDPTKAPPTLAPTPEGGG